MSRLPIYPASTAGSAEGAGQCAPAQARVARKSFPLNQIADRTEPPVFQLAHIEISVRRDVLRPSEEDVARRLHNALTLDHTLALVPLEFRPQPFEYGFASFLDLQE